MKKRVPSIALVLTSLCGGCPTALEIDGPFVPTEVLAVRPRSDVGPTDVVQIVANQPLALEADRWPVQVVDMQGRLQLVTVTPSEDRAALDLEPVERWGADQRMEVVIGEGIVGPDGTPLRFDASQLVFSTRAAQSSTVTVVSVRSPRRGRLAPLNLERVVVSLSPPDGAVDHVRLVAHQHELSVPLSTYLPGGPRVAELPRFLGPCEPLCPSTVYRVRVPGTEQLAGIFATSTVTDHRQPELTLSDLVMEGDTLRVEIRADEPVFLGGTITAEGQEPILMVGPTSAVRSGWVVSAAPLAPGTAYRGSVYGRDLAGLQARSVTVTATSPPDARVMLTEVVPAPVRDWGDSDLAGEPFDETPGTGSVSDADEWLEIVNQSDTVIDLDTAGLVVQVLDSSPSVTHLPNAPAMRVVGGRPWRPGEALVLRPRGAIAQGEFIVEIYAGSRLLDRLVVGDRPGAQHHGGRPPDVIHESLARDAAGRWRWCKPTPGDPLAPEDCL